MSRLRIGYIGAGGFTNGYMYPQLNKHDIDLVAVCDLVEEKVKSAQRRYGFQHAYTDFHKMCDEQELDAVFCVGGPKVHYAVGMEILKRGLPLYIQKSPAPTAKQTREMAELAKEKNVVCHVGFNIRSSRPARYAKEWMSDASFGRPTLGIVRYGLVSGATLQDAVMDQHCHAIDTARWFMGDIRSLQVAGGDIDGVRNYVVAVQFVNGSVGTINFTSELGALDLVLYELIGEKGNIIHCHQGNVTLRNVALPRTHPDVEQERRVVGHLGSHDEALRWNGYIDDVANFLAAVRGDEPDRSPIESTIGTMEACEEIYRQLLESGLGGLTEAERINKGA